MDWHEYMQLNPPGSGQCPNCHGEGRVWVQEYNPDTDCYVRDKDRCPSCGGTGLVNGDD